MLYREGPRLVFVDRGTRWTVWLRFVLGLVAAITGVNAVVMLALMASGQGSWVAGLVLAVLASAAGFGFAKVHRHATVAQARSPSELTPMLGIDLERQTLFGPGEQVLAPLDQVSFHKVFQVTSSAKALECRWPGGRMTVSRGGGMGVRGVDGALEALRGQGLRAG